MAAPSEQGAGGQAGLAGVPQLFRLPHGQAPLPPSAPAFVLLTSFWQSQELGGGDVSMGSPQPPPAPPAAAPLRPGGSRHPRVALTRAIRLEPRGDRRGHGCPRHRRGWGSALRVVPDRSGDVAPPTMPVPGGARGQRCRRASARLRRLGLTWHLTIYAKGTDTAPECLRGATGAAAGTLEANPRLHPQQSSCSPGCRRGRAGGARRHPPGPAGKYGGRGTRSH